MMGVLIDAHDRYTKLSRVLMWQRWLKQWG
jgi:hypothetical protein